MALRQSSGQALRQTSGLPLRQASGQALRDPETEWIRVQGYRRMSGRQRLEAAAELYEMVRELTKANILNTHPGISDSELRREMARRLLPRDLFRQVGRCLDKSP